MSTIKRLWLPDFAMLKGLLLCVAIWGMRHYLAQSLSTHQPAPATNQSPAIEKLFDHCVKTTLRVDESERANTGLFEFTAPGTPRITPTDPKVIIDRWKKDQDSAMAAEKLLGWHATPAKATEHSAPAKLHTEADQEKSTSITFADGIQTEDAIVSNATPNVDHAKTWLVENLGRKLSWFDRNVLQGNILPETSRAFDNATSARRNLVLRLSSGMIDDNARILAVRNDQCFVFDVPAKDQQRFDCVEQSIAYSEKGNWNSPAAQLATIRNMACRVLPGTSKVAHIELSADCKFDVPLEDESFLVLAEIWQEGNHRQNFARVSREPGSKTFPNTLSVETDAELTQGFDPNRPLIVFLSLVKDEQRSGSAMAFSESLASKSQYRTMSNVLCVCYDNGSVIYPQKL